jgi:diguanylate cyclase (GGDEF)-like protein
VPLRSLASRLAAGVGLLAVLVIVLAYLAARGSISAGAERHARAELSLAESALRNALREETDRLVERARTLAGDTVVREALATRDRASLNARLENMARRMDVDVAVLEDAKGRTIAGSLPSWRAPLPRSPLLPGSRKDVAQTVVTTVSSMDVLMLAAYPVSGSTGTLAVVGTMLDEPRLRRLSEQTGVTITVARKESGRWRGLVSSGAATPQVLAPTFAGSADDLKPVDGRLALMDLVPEHPGTIIAVLEQPASVADAPFDAIHATLAAILAAGLAALVAGSLVLSRTLTRPLRDLAGAVAAIGDGRYAVAPLEHGPDEVRHLARALHEMSDQLARREQRIAALAYADTLTGLPNRNGFVQGLVDALARRRDESLVVLVMDVDRFGQINHALGMRAADAMLRGLADLLRRSAGSGMSVARIGGDEFAVLFIGSAIDEVLAWSARLEQQLRCTDLLHHKGAEVSVTSGIAACTSSTPDVASLLAAAEAALQGARQARTPRLVFDPAALQIRSERLTLLRELRNGIAGGELRLVYQPKVALRGTASSHVEALLRWRHPMRGDVPPGDFVPFAEETGFVREITGWALRSALSQLAAWDAAGYVVHAAVNVSPLDLLHPFFVERLRETALATGGRLPQLRLEITEGAVMRNPARAIEVMHALRALGVTFAIDDFGVGYSSFSQLRHLPVDELKIDRSFVAAMNDSDRDRSVVASIIDLAHRLDLEVTAEGVETSAALEALRELGCDYAQGFLAGRPRDADRLAEWLGGPPSRLTRTGRLRLIEKP